MSALTDNFEPASLDIFIDQGDDFNKLVTLTDSDGNALDLSNFEFSATLKEYYNTAKNFGLEAEIYGDPTEGKIRIFMSTEDTQALVRQRYVYAVKATNGIDTVRVVGGQALIQPVA